MALACDGRRRADATLSRWRHGFESRWGYQHRSLWCGGGIVARPGASTVYGPTDALCRDPCDCRLPELVLFRLCPDCAKEPLGRVLLGGSVGVGPVMAWRICWTAILRAKLTPPIRCGGRGSSHSRFITAHGPAGAIAWFAWTAPEQLVQGEGRRGRRCRRGPDEGAATPPGWRHESDRHDSASGALLRCAGCAPAPRTTSGLVRGRPDRPSEAQGGPSRRCDDDGRAGGAPDRGDRVVVRARGWLRRRGQPVRLRSAGRWRLEPTSPERVNSHRDSGDPQRTGTT